MAENPIIGEVDCPNCTSPATVKQNKNGAGYFFCACGFSGRYSKQQTRFIFIEKQASYEQDEPTPVPAIRNVDAGKLASAERAAAEQNIRAARAARIPTAFD